MRRLSAKAKKGKSSNSDDEEPQDNGSTAAAVSDDDNSDSEDNTSPQKRKNKRRRKSENVKSSDDGDSNVDDAKKRKKKLNVSFKEDEQENEPEEVLDSKMSHGSRHFKIRWKDCGPESDSWEPEKDLDCPELIQAYLDENPDVSAKGNKSKKQSGKSAEKAKKAKKDESDESEEEEKVNEVEEVLDSKMSHGSRQFKIRWKGCGPESDSWESEKDLDCPKLIQAYLDDNPDASAKDNKSKKHSGKSGAGEKTKKVKKEDPEDSEEEITKVYEVEKVVEVYFKKNGKREFLIRWKGFTSNEDTWEPEENLSCPDLIEKYMAKVEKAKVVSTKELRANPQHTDRFTLSMTQSGRRLSRRHDGKQRATYHDFE